MDTKEKRRRRPTGNRQTPGTRSAAGARKRSTGRIERKGILERRKAPARRQQTKRVVKAPRENIPEVVYTNPKPFRRGKFLVRLFTVFAVVLALMLAVSIFFKVDTVTVAGAEKYTPWMVREASGIQEGEGLLSLSKARIAGKIRSELPYVDDVKVGIKLPGTVNIEITELAVTYAVEAQDGSWWLITSDGRIVEQVEKSAAASYTRLLGVQAEAPRAGQQMAVAEDLSQTEPSNTEETQPGDDMTLPTVAVITNAQRFDAALQIFQYLEHNGIIGQVTTVNVESMTDIVMQYGQRFKVKLGTAENLEYKVGYMAQAINQIAEYQSGILDVSFEYSQDGIFTPDS